MTTNISFTIPDEYYTKEVQDIIDGWQTELGLLCNDEDSWNETSWRSRESRNRASK